MEYITYVMKYLIELLQAIFITLLMFGPFFYYFAFMI